MEASPLPHSCHTMQNHHHSSIITAIAIISDQLGKPHTSRISHHDCILTVHSNLGCLRVDRTLVLQPKYAVAAYSCNSQLSTCTDVIKVGLFEDGVIAPTTATGDEGIATAAFLSYDAKSSPLPPRLFWQGNNVLCIPMATGSSKLEGISSFKYA